MLHADLIWAIGRWMLSGTGGATLTWATDFGASGWNGGNGAADTTVNLDAPHMALFETIPTSYTNAGTEASYTGYARLDIKTTISQATLWEWSDADFGDAVFQNGLVNQVAVTFGTCTADGHDVTGWGVYNHLTTGDWRFGGAVTTVSVGVGDIPRFAIGALTLNIS